MAAAQSRRAVVSAVTAAALTDPGLVRKSNEDAVAMVELASGARWTDTPVAWSTNGVGVLLEVSDGMGGAKAGEVASALSTEGVVAGMLDEAQRGRPDGESLRAVIEQVSRGVHAASKVPSRRGMGATLTAALIQQGTAYVAQIGDSRAYLLRAGRIGQVTHDQSYVQMLVDAGVMTPEEAERSPRKNIILQVMGQPEVKVALGRIELVPGDRLLLCSDGLTNVVDDATILEVASAPTEVGAACAELVRRTREGGAPDNVTVLLAELG